MCNDTIRLVVLFSVSNHRFSTTHFFPCSLGAVGISTAIHELRMDDVNYGFVKTVLNFYIAYTKLRTCLACKPSLVFCLPCTSLRQIVLIQCYGKKGEYV